MERKGEEKGEGNRERIVSLWTFFEKVYYCEQGPFYL